MNDWKEDSLITNRRRTTDPVLNKLQLFHFRSSFLIRPCAKCPGCTRSSLRLIGI